MAEYFTAQTDAAIKRYLESDDIVFKHKTFTDEIRPAFEKLIESIIIVYRLHTLGDKETLKDECLSVLFEMLPKFDPNRGKKGFSYFNVVVRNWFHAKYRERNKGARTESDLLNGLDRENAKHNPKFTISPYEDQIIEKEFLVAFFNELEEWRTAVGFDGMKTLKKVELQVLDAITLIMRNPSVVPIFSKKAVQLYIREITQLNSKQVGAALKRLRELYVTFKEDFDDSEEIGLSRA
jgi:hypothetical protein